MIKVNLLTVKRRKPIQIPFAAIFLIIGLVGVGIGFYALTMAIEGYNEDKIGERDKLKRDVENAKPLFTEREQARGELNSLQAQIEQLKQLSGATLLQWSEVFNTMTSVVPKDSVWITNLRIDSDRRVQMTGYACSEDAKNAPAVPDPNKKDPIRLTLGIQNYLQQLQSHQHFEEVFLTQANKNVYEKQPVWRFDITCRIKRDIGGR
jgi:hypothetical protein